MGKSSPATRYSDQFRQQIVDLHISGKKASDLAREYGVSTVTIHNWTKRLAPIAFGEGQTVTLKEFKELKKENTGLREENEILKKATAILAKWR